MRKLLTFTFALFYFWIFTLSAAAAVKVPNVCETQSVDCFVLNLGKNAYVFHVFFLLFSTGVDPVSVRQSRPSLRRCTVNTASVVPS